MLLAIDIGNTNTVFAVFDGETLVQEWRAETLPKRSADEYATFLKDLFELADITWGSISGVIISSVVPGVNRHMEELSTKYLDCTPLFITKDNVGVAIDIDKPEEVGADRLVNAAAILEHYSAPAIVLDFGTATTFDVIDARGAYAGGVIAPGINLSLAALEQAAAKLPHIKIEKPRRAIGKDTVSAMQAGIYYGYKGLIEGIIKDITDEMGAAPFVIATGGLAPLFAENIDVIAQVDQGLTLKGLVKIYKDLNENA